MFSSGNLYGVIAVVILVLLLIKAWVDVDFSWDTWSYHLPWAAKLWGLSPPGSYVPDPEIQYRLEGFSCLAEWLQGFFWLIFQRVQATNLVTYLGFLAYLWFLRRYFKIHFAIAAIALLAVPVVLIHVTLSYVDLIGNLALSVLIMLTLLLYTSPQKVFRRNSLLLLAAAPVIAMNIKMGYLPVVLVVGITAAIALWRYVTTQENLSRYKKYVVMGMVSSALLAFAVPIKNIVLYHNPVYGVEVKLGDWQLSQGYSFNYAGPMMLRQYPLAYRWAYSLMEVNNPPFSWSLDQASDEPGGPIDFMGGYFRELVLFNIAIFIVLVALLRNATAWKVAAFMTGLTLLTANLPQSSLLRYYMYWIIVLVSCNLFLLKTFEQDIKAAAKNWVKPSWLNSHSVGVVYLVFLMIVLKATHCFFIMPQGQSLAVLKKRIYKTAPILNFKPGRYYYVEGKHPYGFLYSDTFSDQPGRKILRYTIEDCGYRPSKFKAHVGLGRCPKHYDGQESFFEFEQEAGQL